MSLAQRMARFNKVITNPIQMLWAPLVAPWAVIVHTGRKSGREYRTPVVALVSGSQVTVALPYGTDTDWVRNLLAAGGGRIVRRRRESRITDPEVMVPADAGLGGFAARLVGRVSHVLVAHIV